MIKDNDVICSCNYNLGLLGEHILETLIDAKSRLLDPSHGMVIPHSAKLYGRPITSKWIAQRNKVCVPHCEDFNENFAWESTIHRIRSLPSYDLDEIYSCESISSIKDIRFISDPIELTYINLSEEPSEQHIQCHISSQIDGHVDALASYFEMYLIDPSAISSQEDWNLVSSHPEREKNGWDQAIFFSSKFSDYESTQEDMYRVQRGDVIEITTSIIKYRLTFSWKNLTTPPISSLSSSPSSLPSTSYGNPQAILHVSESDMSLLNDIFRLHQYMKGACICINDILASEKKISVLELSTGVISVVFMLHDMIRQGKALSVFDHRDMSEIILSESRLLAPIELSNFFCKLSEVLSIPINKNFEICNLIEPIVLDSIDTSNEFDLIICDIIESSGLIKQNILKNLKFAAEITSTVCNKRPRVIPSSISVVIAAIQCESLLQQQSVQRRNTLDIDVSSCIDELGTSLLRELWLPTQSDLKFLSDHIVATSLELSSEHYESTSKVYLRMEESGTVHGIAFWYHIHINDTVYSRQHEAEDRIVIDTYMQNNHYRQATFLLDFSEKVTKGDVLEIVVSIDETSGVFCSFEGRQEVNLVAHTSGN